MKKRNLILSVACSIVLVFVLVGFAIVDIVKPAKNIDGSQNVTNVSSVSSSKYDPSINEGENVGTAEQPYSIYDAETFTTLLSTYGNNSETYFKLLEDIDFTGVDFKPLFNKGEGFKAHLDGQGHTLNNISISVNNDNIADYAYTYTGSNSRSYAKMQIGVFGLIDGAEISNISFNNVTINVANEVYDSIKAGTVSEKLDATVDDVTVGAIAGYVKNATLSAVNVTSSIDADAYTRYADNQTVGTNALGGAFGALVSSTVSDSTVNTVIVADSIRYYWIGGVAGFAKESKLDKVDVNASVSANALPTEGSKNRLYIAGVYGYAVEVEMNNMIVNFNARQLDERVALTGVTSINTEQFHEVAGLIAELRADDDSQQTSIKDVTVHSDVDMDVFFAGAIFRVCNKAYDTNKTVVTNKTYITIQDTIIDSNVNTLNAFGVAAQLLYTSIKYSEGFAYANYQLSDGSFQEYGIKLTGAVRLAGTSKEPAAALVCANETNVTTGRTHTLDFKYDELKLVVSSAINGKTILPAKLKNVGKEV